jgi:hypothetical protein
MLKGHAIQFEGGQLALRADVKLNGAGERQRFGHTIFGSESLEGGVPPLPVIKSERPRRVRLFEVRRWMNLG